MFIVDLSQTVCRGPLLLYSLRWFYSQKPMLSLGSCPRSRFSEIHASAGNADRQGLIAFHKARIHPLGLADHLNIGEPLHDFLPDDLQLQLGQSDSHATVNAEAEGEVGARPGAVDDELVGTIDHLVVAVARDVPHHDLVTFFEPLAAELDIFERG